MLLYNLDFLATKMDHPRTPKLLYPISHSFVDKELERRFEEIEGLLIAGDLL